MRKVYPVEAIVMFSMAVILVLILCAILSCGWTDTYLATPKPEAAVWLLAL